MLIYKYIWLLAAFIRNPSIFQIFKELEKSEKNNLIELEALQFKRLKEILIFAQEHSSFYRRIFNKIGFNARFDFNDISDLKKIPIFTKQDLLNYNEEIHTDFKFTKVFKSETSGTSGQVLKFNKDEYWDSFNRASYIRGYSWYGVKPYERNGYFWGYNIHPSKRIKVKCQDYFQNRFRLFSYDDKSVLRFLNKLKTAKYLSGYSSMIYEVAKFINKEKIDKSKFKLKMIKGTSEKIYDSYQKEIINAFGINIIGEYGAAEAGIIAFECPYKNMHVNMEGVYIEEYDGEIVVTNLIARSFPVIRYRLGDYIKLKPKDFNCPCGIKHQVIESISGRVGKLVIGDNNTFPSLTFYYIFKNLAQDHKLELNYQVQQHEKGHLILLIEQKLNQDHIKFVKQEFYKYFKDDIIVSIFDDSIIHQKEGKLKDFISTIN